MSSVKFAPGVKDDLGTEKLYAWLDSLYPYPVGLPHSLQHSSLSRRGNRTNSDILLLMAIALSRTWVYPLGEFHHPYELPTQCSWNGESKLFVCPCCLLEVAGLRRGVARRHTDKGCNRVFRNAK
jgi:hypothetical protein